MTGHPGGTEARLRETLDALATGIQVSPPAYPAAHAQWRRRERRRRLILAVLIAIVFAVADMIGLWALNQAREGPHLIFDDRAPGVHQRAPEHGVGQP